VLWWDREKAYFIISNTSRFGSWNAGIALCNVSHLLTEHASFPNGMFRQFMNRNTRFFKVVEWSSSKIWQRLNRRLKVSGVLKGPCTKDPSAVDDGGEIGCLDPLALSFFYHARHFLLDALSMID